MGAQHFHIKVIPNAKITRIKAERENQFKVWLPAPAVDNQANKALLELLAKHFNVKKKALSIINGHKSQKKIIELES